MKKTLAALLGFALLGCSQPKEVIIEDVKINPCSRIFQMLNEKPTGEKFMYSEFGEEVNRNPAFTVYYDSTDFNNDGVNDYILSKTFEPGEKMAERVSISRNLDYYTGETYNKKIDCGKEYVSISKVNPVSSGGPRIILHSDHYNPENPYKKGNWRRWVEMWKTTENKYIVYEELGSNKRFFYFDEDFSFDHMNWNDETENMEGGKLHKLVEMHKKELKYWF